MNSPTSLALVGLVVWHLVLLFAIAGPRVWFTLTRQVAANKFPPDNSNLAPIHRRIARAHANSYENLGAFAAILLLAIATDRTSVTDGLAWALVGARVAQSIFHVAHGGAFIVNFRFAAFGVQLIIVGYWCWLLACGA
jgi:uncharacterized MAPEG superfamily protein